MVYFLVDFGATHVKWGTYDASTRVVLPLGEQVFPELDMYEVTVVQNMFASIFEQARGPFEKIFVCSQMHGFYLSDTASDAPCTPYISWKDERCAIQPGIDLSRTGLRPKKGLPVYNMQLFSSRGGKFRLCTFNDILLTTSLHRCHDTLFCGTGFYDLISRKAVSHPQLVFNEVVSGPAAVSGEYSGIPVYTALGDFQAAAYSADLVEGDIFVNLGTGSQVATVSQHFRPDCENRAFTSTSYLNCVTHIPSGRVLVKFLQLFGASFDDLKALNSADVLASTIHFNFNLFESAYEFADGGSISRLTISNFNKHSLLCSLVRCYIQQYLDVIAAKFKPVKRVVLAGGIARIPVIRTIFEARFSNVSICLHDTLHGLAKHIEIFTL